MQSKTIKTKPTIGGDRVKLKILPRFRQDQIFAHLGGSTKNIQEKYKNNTNKFERRRRAGKTLIKIR